MTRRTSTSRNETASTQGVVGGSKELKATYVASSEVEIKLDVESLSRAFDAVRDKRSRIGWKPPGK